MKYHVTLKAELSRGHFYWVADVESESQEDAVSTAEREFLEQVDSGESWEFTEFEVTDG